MKTVALALAAATLAAGASVGQEIDDSFYSLLEKALHVNIAARVSEIGEKAIWSVRTSELTVPGKSVNVRLVGDNIVVIAQLTPYVKEGNDILLVAHGQVWIAAPYQDKIQYLTTLRSIPIRLGESVVFFPLGVRSLQKSAENFYSIELEIWIEQRTNSGQ